MHKNIIDPEDQNLQVKRNEKMTKAISCTIFVQFGTSLKLRDLDDLLVIFLTTYFFSSFNHVIFYCDINSVLPQRDILGINKTLALQSQLLS